MHAKNCLVFRSGAGTSLDQLVMVLMPYSRSIRCFTTITYILALSRSANAAWLESWLVFYTFNDLRRLLRRQFHQRNSKTIAWEYFAESVWSLKTMNFGSISSCYVIHSMLLCQFFVWLTNKYQPRTSFIIMSCRQTSYFQNTSSLEWELIPEYWVNICPLVCPFVCVSLWDHCGGNNNYYNFLLFADLIIVVT